MEPSLILNSLNAAQQEAVSAPLCHQLVLAGAGSGKTRVLIHRIAWLIQVEKISPFHILAVTFTNKAANEMRSRVENTLHTSAKTLWIGTFHGLSHRFLRAHWQEAALPQAFQILDSDDQFRLIRRVINSLNLNEDDFPAKNAQWFINAQKEEGRSPQQAIAQKSADRTHIEIYAAYQDACQRAGVIDFTDLLLKTCQVLQQHDALRAHYQQRFRCLLVDEFQDTNAIQYHWLKLLAGADSSVMIVGDDDQSIYGWRGARIENIQRFTQDFGGAKIVRLEQNYRSTGTILKAANALIDQNAGRLGKNLWTEGEEGDPIVIYAAFNEMDEAFFIANRIRELRQAGYQLRQIAVLYRSNAQSRVIEESLMQFGIPYRVYGGLRYFDRAEIKDALAYLRLINNHLDDPAFERIINTPTRGIGDRTINVIRDQARAQQITLWQALLELLAQKFFSARTETALTAFVNLINTMTEHIQAMGLAKQIDYVIHTSGLIEHYRKEKGEKGLTRLENLEELVNAAHQFSETTEVRDLPLLATFLAYAALESGEEQAESYEDGIQLMTLHSAKGLEFPAVFLAGCEEELFPHHRSLSDPKAMEEERRLCYVGVTRAMRKLFLLYAESRRLYGKTVFHRPSRFIREIPAELIQPIRFRAKVTPASSMSHANFSSTKQTKSSAPFFAGQIVRHKIFGEGTVLETEGDGEEMKVKVNFKKIGTKTLLAGYLTPK